MKAPDKAYIFIEELGDVFMLNANTWDNGGEQYIRKDYLLKWAKERYQQTISNVGCYTGHSVWAEVIEKLESL